MSVSYKQLVSFVWQFMRPQRFTFAFIFLAACMWSVDAMVWPYILRVVIATLTKYDVNRAAVWGELIWPVMAGLGLIIFIELSFRVKDFKLARVIPKLEADMRMAMFEHIQRHSPRYFNEHHAGSLANRMTDMTSQVTLILQQLINLIFPTVLTALLGALFFAYINPIFSVLLVSWVVIHFSICVFFARRCDAYEHIHGEARSTLLGKIVDSLTNNYAVNLFYRFAYEKTYMKRLQKEEEQKNYISKRNVEMLRLCLASMFIVGNVAIFSFMFYAWGRGGLSTAEVVQVFNTIWNITMILWVTGTAIPGLFQSIGLAKQALSVMQDPQDIVDAEGAGPLVVAKGEVVFENVCFQYGPKKLFSQKTVHIQGGEKVGLVGYSGAGKSTFINLILRFYPLGAGRILIDGQDIAQVTLESLRTQVALIPQDPLLFHRSLEDNIRFGNVEATQEEVVKAAQLAHCDEFIRKCPEGYQTLVGERGTKLSGGERQRIAIARAMLANAPILILDEATSALDSVTEKYIQESLERLMQRSTTIVIAHRFSTLAKMDRILVFDQGKIVEEGSHSALLHQNGHYARMWKMQAGGFLPDVPASM